MFVPVPALPRKCKTHTCSNPITKTFPRMTLAFSVDATAIWVGALLGIPPLTTYIESATGARGCRCVHV